MRKLNCRGWWEQTGFGRQEMQPLQLTFSGNRLEGNGMDVIGRFQMTGILEGPKVVIEKQYLDRHKVRYLGVYDGEGTYHGHWFLNSDSGNRVIQIDRSKSMLLDGQQLIQNDDIPLFQPT